MIKHAICVLVLLVGSATWAHAQVFHNLEVRIQSSAGSVGYLRVRLLNRNSMQPVMEAVSRPEGQVRFSRIREGDYVVQTFETDTLQATETNVGIHPADPRNPRTENVIIIVNIPGKLAAKDGKAEVIEADIDLKIPSSARKKYESGLKAKDEGDSGKAIKDLRAAIDIYPNYYRARLELTRIFRKLKRFDEALSVLEGLDQIAPRRSEALVEAGLVYFDNQKFGEAVDEFKKSIQREPDNWLPNYYLGWVLLESGRNEAGEYFQRSLSLNEALAVRAYIGLARLAEENGDRVRAIAFLEKYLELVPAGGDSNGARALLARLKGQ